MNKTIVVWALLCWTFAGLASAAVQPIVVPVFTDPSPVIDGNLQDWANKGVLLELKTAEQVTHNRDAWKGPQDLSGWVKFAYDDKYFFVACQVIDNIVIQDSSGVEIWRGDHVMLTVDFARSGKSGDLIQMGLSPGSLKAAGDSVPDIKPELVIWRPTGMSIEGAIVAARRTEQGYDLEAAIPWTVLKVRPIKYQTFGLQVAFSDCDSRPSVQEKVMSNSTRPWEPLNPKRLTPAGLADRTGAFPAGAFDARSAELAKAVSLKKDERKLCALDVPVLPEGQVPTLTFKARMPWPNAGGCSGPLQITVNGKSITQDSIANRPAQMTAVNGLTLSAWYGNGPRLWFGPSYEAIEQSQYKPLDVVSYEYELRLDGLILKGPNRIEFANVDSRPEVAVVMDDVTLGWWPPSRFTKPRELAPAPTGEIPTFEPWTRRKVDYTATLLPGGAVKVAWTGRELVFTSRFSVPDGTWAELKDQDSPGWRRVAVRPGQTALRGIAGALGLERTLTPLDEGLLVRDTLTNTGKAEPLPVMLTHGAAPGPYETLYLGGRPIPTKSGAASVPSNPSVVVLGRDSGFGLMPADDVFRVHYTGSCDEKEAGIADLSLVLQPGVTYRQEWLVVPLPRPDYWHFVNAVRRHFRTNFAIPGSFMFYGYDTPPWKMLKQLEWSGAVYLAFCPQDYYKGYFPHGPMMKTLDQSKIIAMHKTVAALSPQTRRLNYFNCFNYSLPWEKDHPSQWADCRVLLPDGSQVSDGTTMTYFFPTLTNAYGRQMDQLVDWLLNTVGAQGLYWDCYDYFNVTHYGAPWDGWTADIDPRTHRIARRRSNLSILSWPCRVRLTARLLKEGRPLVANGNPSFTSEYQYRFPRFVETADIGNLSAAHLFTPIALGDHITERSEVDSYRWMLRALDWGGLYYWYNIIPSRPAFTTFMFPFSPVELHSGWLLGQERILTRISGRFGWGDLSEFDVHVFDRIGQETKDLKVPRIVKDGKAYGEVRIPEGYAVAIVRRSPDDHR
jgi:hypothetical protein